MWLNICKDKIDNVLIEFEERKIIMMNMKKLN